MTDEKHLCISVFSVAVDLSMSCYVEQSWSVFMLSRLCWREKLKPAASPLKEKSNSSWTTRVQDVECARGFSRGVMSGVSNSMLKVLLPRTPSHIFMIQLVLLMPSC